MSWVKWDGIAEFEMKTRIRELRRERGWTLQDLAGRIGTTAQTVQRLETQNMTVSTDWLEKFGEAFGMDPVSLFDNPPQDQATVAGIIQADGQVLPPSSQHREAIRFDSNIVANPLVFWASERLGSVPEGAYLAVEKLEGRNIENAVGLDAVAALQDGRVVFGRIIRGAEGRFTVVPQQAKSDVWYDQALAWAGKPAAALVIL